MTTAQRFAEKDPTEELPLTFDFSFGLAVNELLTGLPVVSVRTIYGMDLNPTGILVGSPAFDPTNKIVYVVVNNGIDGVDYDIAVRCATSNPQKVLVLACILPVRTQ